MNRNQEPTFTGLIALCLFFPILVPVFALIVIRKIVLSGLRWAME